MSVNLVCKLVLLELWDSAPQGIVDEHTRNTFKLDCNLALPR